MLINRESRMKFSWPYLAILSIVASNVFAQNQVPVLPIIQATTPIEPAEGSERVVKAEDLVKNNIDKLESIGRIDPSVSFNRTTGSVNVRGLDSQRISMMLDNVPLPWISDGARGVKGGLNTIDFTSVSGLDIYKGVGGEGLAGLGGALRVRSVSADDFLSDGASFAGEVQAGYDSADRSYLGATALAFKLGESTRALLQYAHRQGHELKNKGDEDILGALRSIPNPGNYKQNNILLKINHAINNENELELGWEWFSRRMLSDSLHDQGKTYRVGENELEDRSKRHRVWLGYRYQSQQNEAPIDSAGLTIYQSGVKLESNQNAYRQPDARGLVSPRFAGYKYPFGDFQRHNSLQEKAIGLNGDIDGYIQTGVVHHWQAGFSFNQSKLEQYAGGLDNCAEAPPIRIPVMGPASCNFLHTNQADQPDVKSKDWSLWLADEIQFGVDKQVRITPSIRYDAYSRTPNLSGNFDLNQNRANATFSDRSGSRFSPSLLVSWDFAQQAQIFARYAYGMRAPTAAELFSTYGAPGTYIRQGNPDLKNETSRGLELGLKYGDEKQGAYITLFDNRYKNFIDTNVSINSPILQALYPMGVTSAINREKARIYGVELGAVYRWANGVFVRGDLSASRGKDISSGRPLNSVVPLKTILSIGYEQDAYGVQARFTGVTKRSRVNDEVNDFKVPGYGLVDLSAYWHVPSVKGLTIQASINNVLDKKYWTQDYLPASISRSSRPLDFYTNTGRSAQLNVRYRF